MNYCGSHPLRTEHRDSTRLTLMENVLKDVLLKWMFRWFCDDK